MYKNFSHMYPSRRLWLVCARCITSVLFCLFTYFSFGQVSVSGYYRSNGTYVQPHMRSSPDASPYNNYSYPGNTNPYTGKVATGVPETYLNRYNSSTQKEVYTSLPENYDQNLTSNENSQVDYMNRPSRYDIHKFPYRKGIKMFVKAGCPIISSTQKDAKLIGETTDGYVILISQLDEYMYVQQSNLIGYLKAVCIESMDDSEYYQSKVMMIDSLRIGVMSNSPILSEPFATASIVKRIGKLPVMKIGLYDEWFIYVVYDGKRGFLSTCWLK